MARVVEAWRWVSSIEAKVRTASATSPRLGKVVGVSVVVVTVVVVTVVVVTVAVVTVVVVTLVVVTVVVVTVVVVAGSVMKTCTVSTTLLYVPP